MSKTVYKTGTVPTVRYRILAVVFFLLAVGGLFLGLLGKFSSLFAHSEALLYPFADKHLNGGTILAGSLVGYLWDMLKYFFTGGLVFAGQSIGHIALELIGLVQVLFLAAAIVLSLVLAIASCIVRGKASRNCAMLSGYLVSLSYLWVFVTVLFYGAGSALPTITFFGAIKLSFDLPTLIVGGGTLLILAIVTICRRKAIGLLNVLCLLLMAAAALGLCLTQTVFRTYVADALGGLIHTDLILGILVFALVGLLTFDLVLSVLRLNAKRFYPFDAVRYGLLFLAAVAFNVYFIVKKPVDGNMWYLFTHSHMTLIVNALLLGAGLLGLIFGIINSLLICKRRRDRNARNVAAELNRDVIDREGDDPIVAYNIDAPLDERDVRAQDYERPIAAPVAAPAPAPQPAPAPATTVQTVVQPIAIPVPQPAPAPAPQPAPAPAPQPAPQPVPMPMPVPMQMGMQPPQQPMRPMPPYQPQPPLQPTPVIRQRMPQQPSGPIVFQQAPSAPPVVILQMPPMMQYAYPPQAPQTQPVAQTETASEKASEPAPEPEPAPAQPEPAPAPQPVDEESLGDFARMMLAMARAQQGGQEEAPAGEAQAAPAAQEEQPKPAHSGAYDVFFESLTDEEKEEFHDLFIAHKKGDFGLPAYNMGGDNSEFFGKVFGALGKFRKYISTELLSKVYNYANK